jgi:exonuclease III
MEKLNKKTLKIIHWNCNSIRNKIYEFENFINTENIDIILLNETKINDLNANLLFNKLINYKYIHKQRNGKNGAGGVAIILKKNINFEQLNIFDNLHLELLAINIKMNNESITLISYYNPPSEKISDKLIEIMKSHKLNYLLCGDLNAKSKSLGCRVNNSNGTIFESIMCNNDFIVLNDETPTYYSFNSSVEDDILDFAICSPSIIDRIFSFEVLSNDEMTSDHCPILIKFNVPTINNQNNLPNMNSKDDLKFNFNKANWSEYKNNLPKFIPPELDNNVELLNKFVTDSMLHAAKLAIPTKHAVIPGSTKRCKSSLPNHILLLIKKRKYYRKVSNKNEDQNNKKMFNLLTKFIRLEIDALKNSDWQNFIRKQGANPINTKPFWQKINSIRGNHSNNNLPVLKSGGMIYESDTDKADLFANILKMTFSNQSNQHYDEAFKQKVEKEVNNHDYNKHNYQNKDLFVLKDMEQILKCLKLHSAPGEDGIHNQMIKNCSYEFKTIILKLINLTIKTSKLPSKWKTSMITMIPKKASNSTNPKDYRPISLTSNVAKIAEKMVSYKLKEFLKQNNVIIKQQSGFRNHRQTKDNLLFITQKISEQFNRRKKVLAIFFDIAAAFDKVWHKGLLYKLIKLKVPNYIISWIYSFLESRTFCVRVNNDKSNTFNIETGVPQGAALSPILFFLYINDIPIMSKRNKDYCLLFADDLVSLNTFKRFGNIEVHVQCYLKKLEKWLSKWRLMMSPVKCNYLVFSNNSISESNKIKLTLFNENLKINDNPTFLGIRFDNKLSFIYHINYIKDTSINRLNLLKIVSNKSFGLNIQTLNQIYVSIVRSVLEYFALLSPILAKSNFNKLVMIQNRAIKIINHQPLCSKIENIETDIEELHKRFEKLNINYYKKAIHTKNELVIDLINDYLQYSASNVIRNTSALCNYRDFLRFEIGT